MIESRKRGGISQANPLAVQIMAPILTYAMMADAVYGDNPIVKGWVTIGFQESGSGIADAFQGAAFKNGNEIVLAFKGTSQMRDVAADAKLAIGMNTFQYSCASDFVDSIETMSGAEVSLCGHSLGGAIA